VLEEEAEPPPHSYPCSGLPARSERRFAGQQRLIFVDVYRFTKICCV